MEKLEVPPVHGHPLLPITRIRKGHCSECGGGYLYGGYRCNDCDAVFHKACVESDPEISHYSHPDHPLKLVLLHCVSPPLNCHLCSEAVVGVGYTCSICDFSLHISCTKKPQPLPPPLPAPSTLENLKVHEHPLDLYISWWPYGLGDCKVCDKQFYSRFEDVYECLHCNFYFHRTCIMPLSFPEIYHSSHSKHPLKIIQIGSLSYADDKCLLCGILFKQQMYTRQMYPDMLCHCDVCNFSICMSCRSNPPPLYVVSPTTHDHQLHLIPRLLDFTCNACGTKGDRSPYFCLECNFMIHRECIDLPRVININRHDHRISYTCYLGHGNWKCGVCRKEVDGFYGAYSCSKCPNYAVHSRCATREDVWDMVELEGTPEEEEIAPFEVVDENTIKHMSHDHELILYKDGRILHESKLCEACVSQIHTDPFYSCEHCSFILHQTCANLPRKRRHVSSILPFTLQTNDGKDSPRQSKQCNLCLNYFTGFGYISRTNEVMDVRCGSIFEPFVHESHPHPLYYKFYNYTTDAKCDACGKTDRFGHMLCCDECEFKLEFKCATLPKKVMKQRYDDHPLLLSFGEKNVNGVYWCDVCERKLDAEQWFYTCEACGVTLHVSCVVGDFFYQMPGPVISVYGSYKVVPNTSVSRPLCSRCLFRCKLPYILKVSWDGSDDIFCSLDCSDNGWELSDG